MPQKYILRLAKNGVIMLKYTVYVSRVKHLECLLLSQENSLLGKQQQFLK